MYSMRNIIYAVHSEIVKQTMDYEWEIKRENGLQPQLEPKARNKELVRGNAQTVNLILKQIRI